MKRDNSLEHKAQKAMERRFPYTCKTCKRPNTLTAYEHSKGYQCADCTAREEGPL